LFAGRSVRTVTPLTISTSSLPDATVGSRYTATVAAAGGTAVSDAGNPAQRATRTFSLIVNPAAKPDLAVKLTHPTAFRPELHLALMAR
jgi:hypothetical protein